MIQHLSREHARGLIREALRTLKSGGQALFEFFGDPSFYDSGQDVLSPDDAGGGMFNNAYVEGELLDLIRECGGEVRWLERTPITKAWSNFWVCFGRSTA